MLSRSVFTWMGLLFLGLVAAQAGDDQQSWCGVEVVSFTDFDEVKVKLDGAAATPHHTSGFRGNHELACGQG